MNILRELIIGQKERFLSSPVPHKCRTMSTLLTKETRKLLFELSAGTWTVVWCTNYLLFGWKFFLLLQKCNFRNALLCTWRRHLIFLLAIHNDILILLVNTPNEAGNFLFLFSCQFSLLKQFVIIRERLDSYLLDFCSCFNTTLKTKENICIYKIRRLIVWQSTKEGKGIIILLNLHL